jgi:Flp pilus assembly protein TadD
VGLINKAIKKTEKEEDQPAQKEMPAKAGRKKGIAVALAALLVIIVLSGGGYLYLTKPDQQPPRKTARRSITAKRKLQKPNTELSAQEKETQTTAEATEQPETTPEEALTESDASQEQLPGAELLPGEKQIPERVEDIVSVKDSQTERAITQEPLEPVLTSTPEKEEKMWSEPYLPEGDTDDPAETGQKETIWSEEEELPEEEIMPFYTSDLKDWVPQRPLIVKDTSSSKAQRYFDKGVAYQKEERYKSAIESYEKALTFNPDHLQAHLNLAIAYLQTGRFKQAEQKLIYLYALKPNDCTVLYNFGLLLYKTGELFSAETKLKRLVELDPLHLEAHLLLGSIYEEKREINQALELYVKAYRINSADPGVLYRLGRVWDIKGELVEAVKYYRSFLNTAPQKNKALELTVRDRLNYLVSQKENESE